MPPAITKPPARARLLGTICVGILAAVAFAGLSPFNPFPRNEVTWIADQNGLRFGRDGIALASENLRWPASSDSTCSLEIWLRPDSNTRSNNIFTFYSPEAPQRFRLFQWSDSTLLLYHDLGGEHREIDIENALSPGVPLLITVAAGPDGTAVYLNGVLQQSSSRLKLTREDLSGQIILGTSPLGIETWSGEIRGIALYGAELTPAQVAEHFEVWSQHQIPMPGAEEAPLALYSFSERSGNVARDSLGAGPDLFIPATFQIPHKRFLALPGSTYQWSRGFVRDIYINIAGFMVLGFFLCLYGAARFRPVTAAFVSIASGAAISLLLEALQMFLPTRTSSIVDLAANTLGAALGALLAFALLKVVPRAKPG